MTDQNAILAALSQITDPDSGKDIVSAGMVTGLAVTGGQVRFALEVAASRGGSAEPLRAAAEAAARAVPGVDAVMAILTAEREAPNAPTLDRSPNAHQRKAPPAPQAVPGIKQIIVVASGKGGVGKSTTAVNLALGLKLSGLKVGMLDADVYGPSLPRMLGTTGKPQSPDGKNIQPPEAFGMPFMSMGLMVEEAAPIVWRGPMVQSGLTQMLRNVLWGELDVLVVDMPPGTGDAQLSITQLVPLAGAVIVSTPQDIALIDARKGMAMFEKVDVPLLGLVENMSLFICPSCGHEAHIFGHDGARQEAEKTGIPFLGAVPLDLDIRLTSDDGAPITVSKPGSGQSKAYIALAAAVRSKLGL